MTPTEADLEGFRSELALRAGLRFPDDKLLWLGEVLAARLRATACAGPAAYLELLAGRPGELAELMRVVSVGETYFFRNRDQFRALAALLESRAETGSRRLRLLSAGCSSGEEPYSLAMTVLETLPDAAAWDLDIVACDLNPEVLEKARQGRYSSWSLRETPPEARRRYFSEGGGTFSLVPEVRRMVRFEQRNLAQPDQELWRAGAFDVVFCRNVLMYFTPDAARLAVDRIAEALVPGGHLFLGHAENLRGISRDFHLRHELGTFFYSRHACPSATGGDADRPRLAGRGPAATPQDTSWCEAIARSSRRIEAVARGPRRRPERGGEAPVIPRRSPAPPAADLEPALELLKRERYREALELLGAPEAEHGRDPDSLLLRAMLQVSSGDAAAAERSCDELLAVDELNAGGHYVKALCREHAGDLEGAVEHDQIAAYLDPTFAMPHLHRGLLARRAGDAATACRELELARGLLPREDAARIVLFGGGFGRQALIAICGGEPEAVEEAVSGA